MSQVYQIQLANSISRTLCAEDEQRHRIELTPILSPQEMQQLLAAELSAQGWQESAPGVFEKRVGEEERQWRIQDGEVVVRRSAEREVSAQLLAKGRADNTAAAQREAEKELQRQQRHAEVAMEESRRAMAKALSDELSAAEQPRKRELNTLLQKVHAEALKQKARSMGTVLSIDERESGEEYELVIRIAD